jgi:hypothetical protein
MRSTICIPSVPSCHAHSTGLNDARSRLATHHIIVQQHTSQHPPSGHLQEHPSQFPHHPQNYRRVGITYGQATHPCFAHGAFTALTTLVTEEVASDEVSLPGIFGAKLLFWLAKVGLAGLKEGNWVCVRTMYVVLLCESD